MNDMEFRNAGADEPHMRDQGVVGQHIHERCRDPTAVIFVVAREKKKTGWDGCALAYGRQKFRLQIPRSVTSCDLPFIFGFPP